MYIMESKEVIIIAIRNHTVHRKQILGSFYNTVFQIR